MQSTSSSTMCKEYEISSKANATFATRVHKNILRLLHRRPLEATSRGSSSKPKPQNKLIERLKLEEGINPISGPSRSNTRSGSHIGSKSLVVHRGPPSPVAPFTDIPLTVPVRRGSLFSFPIFKPNANMARQLTKLSLATMQNQRRSSTSSAFVKDTISNPDRPELLLCITYALYYHMSRGMQTKVKIHEDIFSEKLHPMTKEKPNFTKMPPMDIVYHFVKILYEHARSDHEVIIMSLAYVERVMEMSKITFDASNWRRLTLAAFIVADKAWNDLAVWNEDFLTLFKGYVKIRDLNALEMKFLSMIQYKVFMKSSMYTKYYFELKAFSKMHPNVKLLELAPPKSDLKPAESCAKAMQRQQRRSMSLPANEPLKRQLPLVLN